MSGNLVVVLDAPIAGRGPFNGAPGEVLLATLQAVARAAGVTSDVRDQLRVAFVSAEPTPGDKPPKIAVIRERRAALLEEVEALEPRAVLALGAAAATALSGAPRSLVLKRVRGQAKWLELPSGRRVPWVSTVSAGSVAAHQDLYRDLSADAWKAWTIVAPEADPDVEIVVPRDVDALRASLSILGDATAVSCDVETTGLRPYADHLLTVGFGAIAEDKSGYAVIVPYELLDDPEAQDLCWDAIYTLRRRTIFQNGKFDMAFLSVWLDEPIPREALLGDTLLLGALLDERPNRAWSRCRGLGLKDQAAVRYDHEDYAWDWTKFYATMHADERSFKRVKRSDTRLTLGTGVICDDCQRFVPRGEDVTVFSYEDLPGPEFVCDACFDLHDRLDRWPTTDWDGLYGYLALDVYYTTRLWHDLVDEARSESPRLLEAHDEVLIPAARTLSACELRGAPIDADWLRDFAAWLRSRIERRERALVATLGALRAPDDLAISSPAQIADLMYDTWRMTPDVRRRKGLALDAEDRSTDKVHIEGAIVKYRAWPDPLLRKAARWLRTLLRWRADQKNLSTYSESILERADAVGRVHSSFWLHGASTGRLSSSEPNLQNIPAVSLVNGEYVERRSGKPTKRPARRGFAPAPGWLIVEADYSQLELRVAAGISGDERMRQVFIDGLDIHTEVASTMFSKPADEISKPERFLAKAVDFGILYGKQGKAISKGAEMDYVERELHGKRWDEATAEAFIAKFMRGYPRLAAWLVSNAADTLKNYYVETAYGRRRRFPMRPRTKWERMAIERQANNTPIQGTASDICLTAMSRIEPRLPEGALLLFPVHDSIVLEVREDLMAEVEAILREEMEGDFMGVPLTIDIESGPSWADVH